MILGVTLLVVLGTIIGAVLYGRAQSKAKSVEEWALGFGELATVEGPEELVERMRQRIGIEADVGHGDVRLLQAAPVTPQQ